MDREGRNYDEEETSGSGRSMRNYILTYSSFKGKTDVSSGFSTEGTLISAFAVPHCGTVSVGQVRIGPVRRLPADVTGAQVSKNSPTMAHNLV